MNHPLLIDTDTLQDRLGTPGLVVLDVRGRAAYEFGGHIPGAVQAEIMSTAQGGAPEARTRAVDLWKRPSAGVS